MRLGNLTKPGFDSKVCLTQILYSFHDVNTIELLLWMRFPFTLFCCHVIWPNHINLVYFGSQASFSLFWDDVTHHHTPYTENFQGNSERAWRFSALLFCNRKLFQVWFGVESFCVIKAHSFLLEKKCLCDFLLNFNEMKIGSSKLVTTHPADFSWLSEKISETFNQGFFFFCIWQCYMHRSLCQ